MFATNLMSNRNPEMAVDEILYEGFHEALFEMLSNWRNPLSASDLYHLMIHIWAENTHYYLNDALTEYDCGKYHHRLLDFMKSFKDLKVENETIVYYFIHNLVEYLAGYLENIEVEYEESHKRKLRWEIAELFSFSYGIDRKNGLISFNNWGRVSFRENQYAKSYGQVFKLLTQDKWNIKNKNKKIYPRFNYPEAYSQEIFEEISGLFLDHPQIFEDEMFFNLFKKTVIKKGLSRPDIILEYFNLVKVEKELQIDIFVEFVDNYLDWNDLFYDGLELEDFYQCYLKEEDHKRLKYLQECKLKNLNTDELKQILEEIKAITFKATQWTTFLRLNFCSLDKKSVPGVIFSDDYMKLL